MLQICNGTALFVDNVFARIRVDGIDEVQRPIQAFLGIDH